MIRWSPKSQTSTEPPCRLLRALVMIRVFGERFIKTERISSAVSAGISPTPTMLIWSERGFFLSAASNRAKD
jgi:hypothetical protein